MNFWNFYQSEVRLCVSVCPCLLANENIWGEKACTQVTRKLNEIIPEKCAVLWEVNPVLMWITNIVIGTFPWRRNFFGASCKWLFHACVCVVHFFPHRNLPIDELCCCYSQFSDECRSSSREHFPITESISWRHWR